jgi:hypothetical protein
MGQTASNQPGEQRRRSTRLLETVPLVVRGVDLLGQPFEERTSTLALSYHGCRYPSKHHLPKNTWLTVEIPEREGEENRRCLRARVAWIQRPRSVRELFQIGVELETPGNVWGVTFPPEDWTSSAPAEMPVSGPAQATGTINREIDLSGFAPAPSAPVPAPLAGYIDRMLADSRLRTQTAGAATAGEEGSPLLHELGVQLERHAEKTMEVAAARVEQLIRRATEESDKERQASAENLRKEWKKEFERFRKEALEQLANQSAEARQSLHSDLAGEWEGNLSRAREMLAELDREARALRAEVSGAAEGTANRLEQLRGELQAAEAAARQRQENQRSAAETMAAEEPIRAAWREQIQAEMTVAREQWSELLQSSLDSAVQRLVARLGENSQNALANAEQRMAARLAEISQPIAQTAAEARETLASVRSALDQEVARARASLGEIEQAANRMSEYSAQLEAASQDTVTELHRRLEGILSTQTAEVNRRAEGLLAGAVERLGALLETAGHESIARTVTEIEARLAPHVERAQDALHQLAAREEQTEETLRIYRERLRQASEQNQRETAAMQAGMVAQSRNDFETVRREAIEKWNQEIEANSVRATHDVAEEMVKTAEWHQRKAQSDLQAIADATLENAARGLDKKSGEAAQKFTGELERQREEQIEQSREQLTAVAGEVAVESRSRFQQATEAAAKSFGQVLENAATQAHERFAATSQVALEERAARLQAIAEELRGKLESEARRFNAEFQARLADETESSVAGAHQALDAQFAAMLESFRAQRDAQEQEWLTGLERLSGESLSQYEERLRTAGDSWMLTSVKKLNEHGQNVIDSLSKNAEKALRNTCSKVFDGLAATMRERLLGKSEAVPSAAGVPLPGEDPTPPEKISVPEPLPLRTAKH